MSDKQNYRIEDFDEYIRQGEPGVSMYKLRKKGGQPRLDEPATAGQVQVKCSINLKQTMTIYNNLFWPLENSKCL